MSQAAAFREGQKLATGADIELFILDLSPIGVSEVYRFTSHVTPARTSVFWDGNEFVPADIESEGWEYNGVGPFPQPVFRITNVFRFLSGLLYTYNDLCGASLTRIKTYEQFLDGGSNADPTAIYAPDIYTVFQKRKHTKKLIEFVLSADADQEGETLPKRKVLRDTCSADYRVYKPAIADFDYANASCPYIGTAYWDENGDPTTKPKDQCGYRKGDCKKRFPKGPLPMEAFPGVVRVNYS